MITVSAAVPGDALAMAGLLAEMDRFYGADATEPVGARVRQINEAIFSSPPAAWTLVARDGTALAGIASYSFLWPAVGLTRSLYLKELYVGERYRRQGVARLLMQALFEVAAKHGCSRVEWTTDTSNASAQAFYQKLGMDAYPSKVFYRVEDTGTGFGNPW